MVSQGVSAIPGLSVPFGMESHSQQPQGEMSDMLAELIAEKESIDPAYTHCARLLEAGALSRWSTGSQTDSP